MKPGSEMGPARACRDEMPNNIPSYRPRYLPTRAERRREAPRDNTAWRQFINSPAWRRMSKFYLARNVFCVHHLASGEHVPATQVHHVKGQDMEYAFNEDALEALCQSCHSRVTAREMRREP